MIRVTGLYPAQDGKRFDMDYFLNTHVPLAQSKFGSALKRIEVDEGLGGGAPMKPTYAAIVHMLFDSVESFQEAFGANQAAIMGDVPNYTDIEPVIQISQVRT